ncbi:MAG: hypothetical protein RLZZ450_2707 [Pseudomonadota bacterium]
MGSSGERRANTLRSGLSLLLLMVVVACSVGHGEGEVGGTINIAECRTGEYELHPTVFFAESAEELLKIRIQRGSDVEVRSDGLSVLVEDATLVKRMFLDQSVQVAIDDEPRIDLSLYLNETCPAERDRTPVTLAAVSGSVRFTAIYAPEVSKDQVRIAAELTNVRFEDPRVDDRFAVLNGRFDFLYVRGSPAQRFP